MESLLRRVNDSGVGLLLLWRPIVRERCGNALPPSPLHVHLVGLPLSVPVACAFLLEIYAVTSIPFVRRTRAILRSAEFGFFGVVVETLRHTPRLNGEL